MEKNNLIDKLDNISKLIGNTPVMQLSNESKNIYAKLEYTNFSGSIKDRAALSILRNAIENNQINQHTTIIESTSGNFGLSLAMFSIALGIKFIPVIDLNIPSIYKQALELLSAEIIEINQRDESGGYLLNRIKAVENYVNSHENVFHPNQYKNRFNYLGYADMAVEIAQQFTMLEYLVVSVSSGGTISGLSTHIKKYFPKIRIVAVDVQGSLIFSSKPQKRNLSGIGSSIKSEFIDEVAQIDEVMILSEKEIVDSCRDMVKKDYLFAGASSGAAYCAAKKISARNSVPPQILFICPDRGLPYITNIYDKNWIAITA